MTGRKIFVVSLHRTMTRSTDILLSSLGYSTLHFPKFFGGENLMDAVRGLENEPERVVDRLTALIESRDALSDVPIPGLYRTLAERWPGSRFILIKRDPLDWERSVRGHMKERVLSPFNLIQYRPYLDRDVRQLRQVPAGGLASIHERHTREVVQFFEIERGEPDRLCIADIRDGDAGERICAFLGHDPVPLPRLSGRPSAGDLEASRRWVAACPAKSDARYFLATNLLETGQIDEAKEHLRAAIEHEPDQPKPYAVLSELLVQEDHGTAAEMALQAIRYGLKRPRLFYRAARGQARRGQWRDALSLWANGIAQRLHRR